LRSLALCFAVPRGGRSNVAFSKRVIKGVMIKQFFFIKKLIDNLLFIPAKQKRHNKTKQKKERILHVDLQTGKRKKKKAISRKDPQSYF
jgi:hypothetical protein